MMINVCEIPEDFIKMEIKMHLPQIDVIRFLQKKGYEVKAFSFIVPATEELLLSEPAFQVNTFTATKNGEQQNYDTLYLNVFENELKSHLKEIT
ncbi:hypothetical protein [Chryseobacterium cucumeris]|uniref:hypothetical protein n=1 Tax=Chryseobacterium cucumeris TaxID=1813611 RepID=UPI0037BEA0B5